ncbi:uncharacterized protein METZ01_LOCUS370187, partial [marine metagenome]
VADFKLPDLGENIESGEVINVLVSEGDSLSEDQPVVELETDKAVIEVPSSVSGTVTKIMISKGDQAKVGQVLLVVDGDGASSTVAAPAEPEPEPEVVAAPAPEPAAVEAPAGSGPVEVTLPELGEGIDAGDVVSILVSPGDTVEAEQGLVELEIDKGVVEMPSPSAGVVKAIHVKEGDRAGIGQLIVTL